MPGGEDEEREDDDGEEVRAGRTEVLLFAHKGASSKSWPHLQSFLVITFSIIK